MEEVIKASNEVIVISAEDTQAITVIDPKTRGVLEQYSDDGNSWVSRGTLCVAPRTGHILGFQNQKTILNLWNMNAKKVQLRISCSEKITATAVSHSELYFAAGSISGFVYVWDTLSGDLIKKYRPHQKKVTAVQFAHDDGLLITAAEDGIVQIYLLSTLLAAESKLRGDLNNGKTECKAKHTLIGHSERITCFAQSRNVLGKLYTASADKSIIVWDMSKGSRLGQFSVESEITCIAIDSGEEHVLVGCKNSMVYKIRVNENCAYKIDVDEVTDSPNLERSRTGKSVAFKGHSAEVTGVALYEEAKQVVSSSSDGLLVFWDFEGNIVKTLNLFNKAIINLSVFRRPRELDQKNQLNQAKRLISFKAFHRYEDGQVGGNAGGNSGNAGGSGAGTSSSNAGQTFEHRFVMPTISKDKKIKKDGKKSHKLTKAAFANSLRVLLGGEGGSGVLTASSNNGAAGGKKKVELTAEQIQELIAENEKLKALNHNLFNAHLTQQSLF